MAGMGVGEIVALAALAGGTALNYQGEREAAKDRRSILNRSMEDTAKASDKATDLVLGEGQNYQADTRQAAFDASAAKAFDQAQRDMQGAGATGANLATAGGNGNVSDAFMRRRADRAIDETSRMTAIAREMAKTRAPGLTRQDETLRGADVAQQTGSIWGTAKNMSRASQQDAAAVQSPWYGQLGKLAQTAALAYLSAGSAGFGAGASGAAGAGAGGATLMSGNNMAYIG